MEIKTHCKINRYYCGEPIDINDGLAIVKLITVQEMVTDEFGLIHGGFIFGLADYAAMLAVNDPNVVLGSADVKFLKPVKSGETLFAKAKESFSEGKKHVVIVNVERDDEVVFRGEFVCFTLPQHVLSSTKT